MDGIELSQFETRLIVRQLRAEDFPRIIELQKICFPGMETAEEADLKSQIAIFPEGQLVVEVDGTVVAHSSSLILDFDEDIAWHDWEKVSDDGMIRNHNPDGDTLYGIEMMVDPQFRGRRLSRRLYNARKTLCREQNIARMIVGGRIPGYHAYAKEMKASEYVDRVLEKSIFDPVLTAQIANGFALQGLIPDYFPDDEASKGFATFLEWRNLEYQPKSSKRFRRAVQMARIGAVQYQMRKIASFEEFATQCEYFIDVAGDYRCDFLLFPELITAQLLSFIPEVRPGDAARAIAEFTPQYLEFFSNMAISYGCNIIGGSTFVVEDDSLYNVAFLFRRDGSIERQSKIHITPSERRWWGVVGGDSINVFDTDAGRIAIQVCYDSEFPELSRIATEKGAQIVFVPYNTDTRNGYMRVRSCSQARCVENHIYTVIAGCTGNLPFVENADIHYAQSAIFAPIDFMFDRDGICASADANIETVIIHDVDLEKLRRHRDTGSVQNWQDRRTDLYRVEVLAPKER